LSQYRLARKGRSHLLLNRTKKEQAEEEKARQETEAKEREEYIAQLEHEVDGFKKELAGIQSDKEEAEKNLEMLKTLYDKSVIDAEGNIIDPNLNH
jgi:archaellum component FlaC